MSETTRARRSPVQERSQETVQRVLAATATLLGRGIAVESLTTAQIATEAGMSVGGLYRFFRDKQAIVDAIAVRHMELFQEAAIGRIMFALPDTPQALLAGIIDAFAAYLEANPDFRTVAYGAPGGGTAGGGRHVSRPIRDAYAGSGELVASLTEFVSEAFDVVVDEAFGFRLRIATEIGDRLLAHAFEQPAGPDRARVLDEAKRLLGDYVFAARPGCRLIGDGIPV
jgi:AcrR family transcriptional regulator